MLEISWLTGEEIWKGALTWEWVRNHKDNELPECMTRLSTNTGL